MSATPTNDEAVETPPEDGVGQHLRKVREALNLGRAEVAAGLYLKEDIITALEEDDRDVLPSPVFVQGYLRKYARLLNIPEEPLLEAYSQQVAPHKRHKKHKGPLAGSAIKPEISSNHAIVRLITWGIVLGLIALLVMWWQGDMPWSIGQLKEEQPAVTQDVKPEHFIAPGLPEPSDDYALSEEEAEKQGLSEPAALEPVAVPETEPQSEETASDDRQMEAVLDKPLTSDLPAEAIKKETEAVVTDETAPSQETAIDNVIETPRVTDALVEDSAEPDASIDDSDAEQIPAAPIDYANNIVIEFSEPCWTEVRGFNGSYKLLGNMQKGERRVLGGEPPYTFLLGNSQAATLTIKGQRFDIEAHSNGNVARFELQVEDISNP